jgi:uncharacterized protein
MALFDLNPKETPSGLFGRDPELSELVRLVRARRWVTVLGPRMVGKTSLVKAARSRLGTPGAYVSLWDVRSVQGLLEGLILGLNQSKSLLSRIRGLAKRINGLSVGPLGLSLARPDRPLRTLWELLDLVGSESKDCLFVLDEVQELSFISGRLLKLLANLFNTRPNLVFVFTGSLFGLNRTLLEPEAASPLYGRAPVPLRLGPFSPEVSEAFLRQGAREAGIRLSSEVIRATAHGPLDGTPGWLTLFGNHVTVRKFAPERAMQETVREAKRVVAEELRHFLVGREPDLYWPALKAAAVGAGWNAVREYMSGKGGILVNHGVVGRVLQALQDGMLVVHESGQYRVRDPMVRQYVSETSRAPPRVSGRADEPNSRSQPLTRARGSRAENPPACPHPPFRALRGCASQQRAEMAA